MSNYEELVICNECLSDKYLIDQLPFKLQMNKRKCSNCSRIQVCVEYEYLEKIVKKVILDHYTVVSKNPNRPWIINDFSYRFSLEGAVKRLIGLIFKVEEIITNISTRDVIDARNGDYRYLNLTDVYLIPKEYPDSFQQEWDSLVVELKTSRRFFSEKARNLFDKIFEDIENLFPERIVDESNILMGNITKHSAVQLLPIGTEIFRARKANSTEDCKRIIENSKNELSPPPSNLAEQGRMNAKGVSIFYGAFDSKTCIAEMRSSIGNYLVLGTFKSVKELRVFDFEKLRNAHSTISIFQPNAIEQLNRYKFLNKLNSLISSPVISGHEDEYLITQVLAEYLAYVRNDSFDGISFESTQLKGGTNIILFPKHNLDEIIVPDIDAKIEIQTQYSYLNKFGLEFMEDSIEVQKTKKITYETTSVSIEQMLNL